MPHFLQGAGISHAGYSCSSRARARDRSIGKIKVFLIVTIFVGRRIARQPSAFRTVVRPGVRLSIGQLVTAGRRPYFASRRYSVDRAIPRRRAACVRFPSQSRTWARIAWRSASRRSPATGGSCFRCRHSGRCWTGCAARCWTAAALRCCAACRLKIGRSLRARRRIGASALIRQRPLAGKCGC